MPSRRITGALRSRVRVGRLAVPFWAILVAALAIAAAAGQALGPVLAGSASGTAQTTVAQTIRLALTPGQTTDPFTIEGELLTPTTHVDYASTMNDEGTEYRIAAVVRVGQTAAFTLALANPSGRTANFLLEISGLPEGVDVVANETGTGTDQDVPALARLGPRTWQGRLNAITTANTVADIVIFYEAMDNAALGTYVINGKITQISR